MFVIALIAGTLTFIAASITSYKNEINPIRMKMANLIESIKLENQSELDFYLYSVRKRNRVFQVHYFYDSEKTILDETALELHFDHLFKLIIDNINKSKDKAKLIPNHICLLFISENRRDYNYQKCQDF